VRICARACFCLLKEIPKRDMPRIVFAVLLILFGVNGLNAQQITLKLVDETGEGLPGATVRLIQQGDQQNNETTLSDVDGLATLNISSYPAQLEINNLGYNTLVKTIKEKPSGVLNIELNKKYTGLNEVVVTGVGRPTKLDEAVSLYRIVSKEDIRAQGAVTLNDAIRNQLGLNVGNDPALGATISMRGLSGNNVKILIDGLPLNGRENGNIDMSQINMSNIERVEMVQGPMSIMYGSDALGGVINLITKTNQTSSTFGANAFYETIGKYNIDVNGNLVAHKHSFSLNVGRNFFQGWDPLYKDARNPLWRPKELYFANFKYTYKISDNAAVTYGMDLSSEKLYLKGDTAGFTYLNKNAFDQEYVTTRFINRLIATWKTGASGYWQSSNSFSVYNRKRRSYFTDLTTMDRIVSTAASDNSTTKFNDFVSRTTYNNKVGMLNYTVGYDVNISIADGVDKIEGGKKTISDYAGFLTADIALFSGFKLQPAIRATYNSSYSAPLIPSLAFLYKPGRKLTLRGSYARGFRSPALKELFLDFEDANHTILGNPNLKAETGHHVQLSGGYSLINEGKHSITTSLTGFYDDVKNQIALAIGDSTLIPPGSTQPPPYTYVNIGRSRFFVLQWRNDIQWDNFDVIFGGSYNKSITTTSIDNGTVYTTPDFHYLEANAQLNYRIPQLLAGISLFYKYTGSQPMLNGDIMGGSIYGPKTNYYHNFDASVNKQFWNRRLTLTVGVRNLTNNVIINYAAGTSGGGGSHGGGTVAGLAQTPGRSGFATLSLQMGN
jgi:outer membrane receptor for ferrienterochelin and colicins